MDDAHPIPAPPIPASVRLTIDLSAIAANWRTLAEKVAPAVCGAVVKADAYGLGTERVAPALWEAGAKIFFVATLNEAVQLRATLPRATIYVLSAPVTRGLEIYRSCDVVPVLGTVEDILAWSAYGDPLGRSLACAIHVDTGMNRLGLSLGEARQIAAKLSTLRIDCLCLISHLACADTPDHPANAQQLARFEAVRALFPLHAASLANSAGVFIGPEYHGDLVRPGIALYGGRFGRSENQKLQSVVRLEAEILQIRDVPAGEALGYGAAAHTTRASRIAVMGIGYADGLHRLTSPPHSPHTAPLYVQLHGTAVPLIGRISMDLTAIDVTECPAAQVGEWVEIIGSTTPLSALAAQMHTIDYEVLTSLSRRAERVYTTK